MVSIFHKVQSVSYWLKSLAKEEITLSNCLRKDIKQLFCSHLISSLCLKKMYKRDWVTCLSTSPQPWVPTARNCQWCFYSKASFDFNKRSLQLLVWLTPGGKCGKCNGANQHKHCHTGKALRISTQASLGRVKVLQGSTPSRGSRRKSSSRAPFAYSSF